MKDLYSRPYLPLLYPLCGLTVFCFCPAGESVYSPKSLVYGDMLFCNTQPHTKVRQSCLTYRLLSRFSRQKLRLAVTMR
jgi:hypothetical protein